RRYLQRRQNHLGRTRATRPPTASTVVQAGVCLERPRSVSGLAVSTNKGFGRVILYEYPCNERVRALLRVEHLFGRLFFFAADDDVHHHQIAVETLFNLLELSDRTDLRGSVLQDLE